MNITQSSRVVFQTITEQFPLPALLELPEEHRHAVLVAATLFQRLGAGNKGPVIEPQSIDGRWQNPDGTIRHLSLAQIRELPPEVHEARRRFIKRTNGLARRRAARTKATAAPQETEEAERSQPEFEAELLDPPSHSLEVIETKPDDEEIEAQVEASEELSPALPEPLGFDPMWQNPDGSPRVLTRSELRQLSGEQLKERRKALGQRNTTRYRERVQAQAELQLPPEPSVCQARLQRNARRMPPLPRTKRTLWTYEDGTFRELTTMERASLVGQQYAAYMEALAEHQKTLPATGPPPDNELPPAQDDISQKPRSASVHEEIITRIREAHNTGQRPRAGYF